MEDTESESESESGWMIQEYSKEDDEGGNIIKWMLRNRCGIGKKIAITGIVISSAPLVLPPLVVFSAMGFAFSVPFGLLFASYACTNKLMSMLLPIPPPPLMIEYYPHDCDIEENENDYGPQVEGYITGKEEETNQEVETESVFELDDDCRQQGETLVKNVEEMEDVNQGVRTVIIEENEDDYSRQVERGYITDKEDNEQMDDINQEDDGYVDRREMEDDMFQSDNVTEEKERKQIDDSVEEERTGEDQLVKKRIYENMSNTQEVNEEDAKLRDEGLVDNDTVEDDCVVDQFAGSDVAFEDVKDAEIAKWVTVEEVESKDNNQTEDVNQGVKSDIVFELEDGSDDYRQDKQTLVMNVDKDVNEREVEMEDDMYQSENVIEEKERERVEDVKQGVEMRPGFDVASDDQGYEEDVEEYLERDDESLEEEQKGTEPWVNEKRSHREEVNGDAKLGDEGVDCDMVEDDYVVGESASNVVFGDVKDVETTNSVITEVIDSRKLVEVGSKNDEPVGEVRHVVILSDGNDENTFNSREVEELDPVTRDVIGDTNKDQKDITSDEKVVIGSMGTQKKTGGENVIMEDHLIHSDAYSREFGLLDLLDEKNANTNSPLNTNSESLEVRNEVKENASDENSSVLAFKQDTENAKVASKKMPTREENLDDEKIWEKIVAMKTIVGYKAPSQSTCIGELKALYVFTGVEPPVSFEGGGEGDSDLDEVNAKLKFLMAIVGVK